MPTLEHQLKNLNRSPASEPNPRWIDALRSKLEWNTIRRDPSLPPLRRRRTIGSPLLTKVWLGRFRRPFAVAMSSLAILLIIGSGITYAAQRALPGQDLYPVKLASEELRLKLASDDTARTELSLELADRRVEEFRVLSARQEITPETAAEISSRYQTHLSAVLTALPALPQEAAHNLTASFAHTIDAQLAITALFEQNTGEQIRNEQADNKNDVQAPALESSMQLMQQQREEIKRQIERLRAFARESSDAAKLLNQSRREDVQLKVKIETDKAGRAHVKIEAKRKKNDKEKEKSIEFTSPTGTIDMNVFGDDAFEDEEEIKKGEKKDEDKGEESDDVRATTTLLFTVPATADSPVQRRSVRGGTQLHIRSESSGSGSFNQEIKSEIKSSSKVDITTGSHSGGENSDEDNDD